MNDKEFKVLILLIIFFSAMSIIFGMTLVNRDIKENCTQNGYYDSIWGWKLICERVGEKK